MPHDPAISAERPVSPCQRGRRPVAAHGAVWLLIAAAAFAFVGAAPLEAQSRAGAVARLAVPAALGSTAGAFVGAVAFGHGFSTAGADYGETMFAVLAGAAVGGTIGSAGLASLLLPEGSETAFLRALSGAALGILPGLGVAVLTQGGGPVAAFIGFGIGQGVTTALFVSR